jgi:Holliday junction resolvasome RuvABC endonuclease subunit
MEIFMILGLDPSLRAFGWTLIDENLSIVDKGLFSTEADVIFVDRYIYLREQLRTLIQSCKEKTDHLQVGIESPIFNDLYSEGMYGLFLYSNEALKLEKMDVVFLTPNQVKAHAHEFLGRPKGWKMQKADMVEACKKANPHVKSINHHQSDAYWVGRIASRFWDAMDGRVEIDALSDLEKKHFTDVDLYIKGAKEGRVKRQGISHKEDDRWFRWSTK